MSSHVRRLASTLFLLGATTSPLAAQAGPQGAQPDEQRPAKANWSLANRFSAASLRSITYTFGVQPRFLGKSDTMYYNWRDRNGSRFVMYVPSPSGGSKRLLFDPSKLAEQLTLLSKKPYDATNLPFQTITFLKSHKAFRFTVDTVRYEWALANETLKSLGRVVRGALPPDDEERDTQGGGGGGGGGQFGGGGGREFRNFAPDSTVFVFARDHNLFLVDVKKGDTTKISTDGVEDYSFGARDTTENRRQLNALSGGGGQNQGDEDEQNDASSRDMRVRPNVVWSPDSRSFSFVRRDQRKVKDLFLVNVLANPRPVLLHYKYTMPGEENVTQSELWVYRRGEPAVKQINVRKWKDQSLQDVHWPISGDKVRLVRRDRPQRTVDFIEVDLASGGIKSLLTDAIEGAALEPKPIRYLKKGGDFLWWSQKTGWGMFYVYGFDGGEKLPLTTGQWNVNSIVKIDSTTQQVWISGQGREPGEQLYQTHLYRVNGNGSGITLLDAGNAHHALTLGENGTPSVVSPSGRYVYDTYSRMDQPPVSVVRDGLTGRVLTKLEEMDLSKLKEIGFQVATPFSVKAADGITELFGNMWKPFDFDSTKKYPVITYVYPGPQTEAVTTGFSVRTPLMQLAQLGFIVVEVGHRGGSPLRSLAYHRYGYGNLRDYALADKKSALEQLASRHAFMDLDKVGIFGHSGGGFLTAAAMLLPPYNEFFKVGWSESGNHDNNIYNQNWSEWNHGVKVVAKNDTARGGATRGAATTQRRGGPGAGNGASREVVQDSTNYDNVKFEIRVPTNDELAGNLKGNLALITGDLDNNVHPGGTVKLASALIKANKRFDFYVYPGEPHGYRGAVGTYNQRMLMEYFAEHLMGDYYRGNGEIK
ncbi:S9 family peptidase [Gemmatimonas phototrophica]|uniref:S9 family peptidase n=1 Tax=Gemmatimonas phototrophica TaxID=1379270 RepID=UPI00047DABA9|nr:DPP IV N-terminal domain-containing protein [Gemmatimonas phototrophica]